MDAEFWEYLQNLITSSSIVIERPQGPSHPDYPDVVYPLDYGYLKSTLTSDLGGIDVWIGGGTQRELTAIICTIDLKKRDLELKLLIGCTETESQKILDFHNSGSMRATLIRHT